MMSRGGRAAAIVLLGLLIACRDEPPEAPSAAEGLEAILALAEAYDDVPDDPVVYGHAAAIFSHQQRRLLHERTAEELERRNATSPEPLLETFRDRELGLEVDEAAMVDALEQRAAEHGYPLPDEAAVMHVLDAAIHRRIASDIEELLAAHHEGTVSTDELDTFEALVRPLLEPGTHGQEVLRAQVARELDPTRAPVQEEP